MSTRIVCGVGDPETDKSMIVDVAEGFDRVMDLIIPVNNPSSAIEARANMVLNQVEGGRVWVRPEMVAAILENAGDE